MYRDPKPAARARLEMAVQRLATERLRAAELRAAVETVAGQLEARGLEADPIPGDPPAETHADPPAESTLAELHAAAGRIEDAAAAAGAHATALDDLLERLAARAGVAPTSGARSFARGASARWRVATAALAGVAAGAAVTAFVMIGPGQEKKPEAPAGVGIETGRVPPARLPAVPDTAGRPAHPATSTTGAPAAESGTPVPPLPARAPLSLAPFGAEHFRTALKIGHGTWRWEGGRVAVYSWSYGLPGLHVFGPAGSGGALEARMKHGSGGDHQGLAFCFDDPSGDCHASGAWLVRYYLGRFELADRVGTSGTVVASSRPIAIPVGDTYVVRLRVVDGRGVTATLDGAPLFEHVAALPRRGRFALEAANGEFSFEEVRFAVEDVARPR